ncbi:MAG: peptidase [Acidobacteriaceae bacterium]|nr:peptidase [Acidobacteriaceae bacterium]
MRSSLTKSLTTAIILAAIALPAQAQSKKIPSERLDKYSNLAVEWLQEYLRIDTTNPPGDEILAADFFKKIFDKEGIENQVFEFDPAHHRANIWAHIRGNGAKRPLILLNHMDVVTSDPARWSLPPFSAKISNGSIYARGAQDMKNEGMAQLMVMVMLKREHVPLDRDVIFLGTADEEVDGKGTDWMIANKRDLLGNAEFLLTEGGYNLLEKGKVKYVALDVAEKSTFWLRVKAQGRPGHGSEPLVDSAPNRLVRALARIINYQTELRLTPVVEEYLGLMAPFQTPERARIYRNIKLLIKQPAFRAAVASDELNPQLRDTISLTMLNGSRQTNVIPGEATANLDVRLLPGEDPQVFLANLRQVVRDPNVVIEPESPDFRISNSSPTNTVLFEVIRKVAGDYFPGTPVVPSLTSGYTENQRYRGLGIVCYGFSPYAATREESATEHGDDERIRVEEVRRGPRVLFDVVLGVAGAH